MVTILIVLGLLLIVLVSFGVDQYRQRKYAHR